MSGAMTSTMDYQGLKELAAELGRPASTLIALAPINDPFYVTPARQLWARWLAGLWDSILRQRRVHVRRIHYVLISQKQPVLTPADGTPYENTEFCWQKIMEAARDARYLGLVPGDHFVDRKNDEPLILLDEAEDHDCSISVQCETPTSAVDGMPPVPRLAHSYVAPTITQRYHVELWCEKTTVNDILELLARRFHCNIVTGSGELSATACMNVVDRAVASGRPVRILYISDFDPGGMSMPVAVARKVEHQIYTRGLHGEIDIEVIPVALTHDQCEEYGLPRTPMKDSERRAARFEERFGEGATELDALEALHPGELERILTREIGRYYDATLDDRVSAVMEQVEDDLALEIKLINRSVHSDHYPALALLRQEWSEIERQIEAWRHRAEPVWQAITESLVAQAPDVPDPEWPEPEDGNEHPDPLFDSMRDYVEQIDRYKRHQGKPVERRQRRRK